MKKLTLALRKIQRSDLSLVGKKAYRLSELLNQGVVVPEAFVVTTKAYDFFLKEHFLDFLHQALTSELSLRDSVFFAAQMREKILKSEVPLKLKQPVLKRFESFGFEKISLRSSATAEDGKKASFAGQFDSFLNVSKEEILEKIKKCWASLFSPRAVVYTHKKKLHLKDIRMAIIIQKMVKPKLAGNLVTKNLIRKREKEMLIEVVGGLGDKVTAGTVIPEQIFIDKKALSVVARRFSPTEGGLLPQDKAVQLSKLGLLIEEVYNFPQEIEWAIEKDKVFILQSRPLTV